MSGPKRSSYSFGQAVYNALKAQRQHERQRQINDIRDRIRRSEELLDRCHHEFGVDADQLIKLTKTWIAQAEQDCNGDLRLAWRGVNGIEKYIQSQIQVLEKLKAASDRVTEQERIKADIKRQEERKKFLADQILTYFDDLGELYPWLLNPGVTQRIEMFRNALTVNPENEETLNKINDFKAQFGKLVEKYESEQDQKRYLKKTLSEIIEADEGGEGGSIVGSFEGVPIKIYLDTNDQKLTFDLPDNGTCKPNITRLVHRFEDAGINLGPVQIIQTGEVLQHGEAEFDDPHSSKA